MKRILREICPPVIYRMCGRLLCRSANKSSNGRERDASYYDSTFNANQHWSQHYSASRYYPLWAVIADRIRRSGARRVIDIGCGPGQFALLLHDQGVPDYLGVDFSTQRIEQARRVCPGYSFMQADIFKSDVLERESYDAFVAIEFFEHIERDLQVMGHIKPERRVYAAVPNYHDPAHVRYFQNAAQVRDRYSPLLDAITVDVLAAEVKGHVNYILEGVRNTAGTATLPASTSSR